MTEQLITIFSVMLGGLIAWSTTAYFERLKRRDEQLSVAYRTLFKVQHFVNEIHQLNEAIERSKERAAKGGLQGPIWPAVYDYVGFSETFVEIDSAELALIAGAGEMNLVMDLRELENGHKIMLQSFHRLIELKHQFAAQDMSRELSERTVIYRADNEQHAKVAPIVINLNDLSDTLTKELPAIDEHAKATATKFSQVIRTRLRFRKFPRLEAPDTQK